MIKYRYVPFSFGKTRYGRSWDFRFLNFFFCLWLYIHDRSHVHFLYLYAHFGLVSNRQIWYDRRWKRWAHGGPFMNFPRLFLNHCLFRGPLLSRVPVFFPCEIWLDLKSMNELTCNIWFLKSKIPKLLFAISSFYNSPNCKVTSVETFHVEVRGFALVCLHDLIWEH